MKELRLVSLHLTKPPSTQVSRTDTSMGKPLTPVTRKKDTRYELLLHVLEPKSRQKILVKLPDGTLETHGTPREGP